MTKEDKISLLQYVQLFCNENYLNKLTSTLCEGFLNQLSRNLDEMIKNKEQEKIIKTDIVENK